MKQIIAAAAAALSLAAGSSQAEETDNNFNDSMHCTDNTLGGFSMYHDAYGEQAVIQVSGQVDVFSNVSTFSFDGAGERSRLNSGDTRISKYPHVLTVSEDFIQAVEINEGGSTTFTADYSKEECSIAKNNGDDKRVVRMRMRKGPGE